MGLGAVGGQRDAGGGEGRGHPGNVDTCSWYTDVTLELAGQILLAVTGSGGDFGGNCAPMLSTIDGFCYYTCTRKDHYSKCCISVSI